MAYCFRCGSYITAGLEDVVECSTCGARWNRKIFKQQYDKREMPKQKEEDNGD